MDALSGEEPRSPLGVTPPPLRNVAQNAQSRERRGPKAKTAAQRRLSRRPDCARAGLRRARAHETNLSPEDPQTRQHGAFARPRSRERGVPFPASEVQLREL